MGHIRLGRLPTARSGDRSLHFSSATHPLKQFLRKQPAPPRRTSLLELPIRASSEPVGYSPRSLSLLEGLTLPTPSKAWAWLWAGYLSCSKSAVRFPRPSTATSMTCASALTSVKWRNSPPQKASARWRVAIFPAFFGHRLTMCSARSDGLQAANLLASWRTIFFSAYASASRLLPEPGAREPHWQGAALRYRCRSGRLRCRDGGALPRGCAHRARIRWWLVRKGGLPTRRYH